MKKKFYKWLLPDRMSPRVNWRWPEPGVWTPKDDMRSPASGYGVYAGKSVMENLPCEAAELWDVEVGVERKGRGCDNLNVFDQARITERYLFHPAARRLWSADCVAHVLSTLRDNYSDMGTLEKDIFTCRMYAWGYCDMESAITRFGESAGLRSSKIWSQDDSPERVISRAVSWLTDLGNRDGALQRAAECAVDASSDKAREREWQSKRILYYAGCGRRKINPVVWPWPKEK